MYTFNSNFKLRSLGADYLLVDVSEKKYGTEAKPLMLNTSAAHIFKLLHTHSKEEVVKLLVQESDNIFSEEDLKANVEYLFTTFCEYGVIRNSKNDIHNDIETIGFGPIKSQLSIQRQPLIGVVEITPKCNCNCPHCYVKGLSANNWLTTTQFIEIAEILQNKGIINITITGGEPLTHPDFKEIYLAFKNHGFFIDIFTNALLIGEDMADFLALNPPRCLDITLYGLNDNEYHYFTGVSDGFTRLNKALNLLRDRGIFFTTKMILHKNNYHNLKEYNQFALSYNAPFRYNVVIGKGNNIVKNPEEIALTNEQILEIERQDPLRKEIFSTLANKCSCLPFDCDENSWAQYPCGAGLDKVFIGYDGKMSPCMTLRDKGLYLFEYGYDAIWKYWGEERKKRLSNDFKCMTCEYLPICTPCTAEFEQENGNKNIPIENRCNLTKLRWETLLNK